MYIVLTSSCRASSLSFLREIVAFSLSEPSLNNVEHRNTWILYRECMDAMVFPGPSPFGVQTGRGCSSWKMATITRIFGGNSHHFLTPILQQDKHNMIMEQQHCMQQIQQTVGSNAQLSIVCSAIASNYQNKCITILIIFLAGGSTIER